MNMETKEKFVRLWKKYFDGAALPMVFYYTNEQGCAELVKAPSGHRCLIADLSRVLRGESLCFDANSVGCGGGKRYLGFAQEIMPDFEHFLSCGIPGKLEGERYKKTPELVIEAMKHSPRFEAPGRFIVFKRWDKLEKSEEPHVVCFFAPPDILSGLFTLANFDQSDPNGVFAPFSAGCGSVVQYPYLEMHTHRSRAVLGMFDVSARPWVSEDLLTFSVPMNRFCSMIGNMEESFLITPSWSKLKKRIDRQT